MPPYLGLVRARRVDDTEAERIAGLERSIASPRVGMGDRQMLDRPVAQAPEQQPPANEEEMRALRAMALRRVIGAREAVRRARLASGGLHTGDVNAALQDAEVAQGEYNRISSVGRQYLTPEQRSANVAELGRQFQQNIGPEGGRIPQSVTPVPDAEAFFLRGREPYQGAGQVYAGLVGANRRRQELNAEQNRPREFEAGPYTPPATAGEGSESDPTSLRARLLLMRRDREAARKLEEDRNAEMLAGSAASADEARTGQVLAAGRLRLAPSALESEGAKIGAEGAEYGAREAKAGSERRAYAEGIDEQSIRNRIAMTRLGEVEREAKIAASPGARAVGDPRAFTSAALQHIESAVSGADSLTGVDFNDQIANLTTNVLDPLEAMVKDDPVTAKQIAAQLLPRMNVPIVSFNNLLRAGRGSPDTSYMARAGMLNDAKRRIAAIASMPIQ